MSAICQSVKLARRGGSGKRLHTQQKIRIVNRRFASVPQCRFSRIMRRKRRWSEKPCGRPISHNYNILVHMASVFLLVVVANFGEAIAEVDCGELTRENQELKVTNQELKVTNQELLLRLPP